MKETIKSIIEWHEQTFPDATLEGQIEKFEDELSEYGESESLEELADLFIVACGIARFDSFAALKPFGKVLYIVNLWESLYGSPVPLQMAIDNKMQTNRKRKWNKIGNTFQHIEEGE